MYKEGMFFEGGVPSDVAAWCNASFKYYLEQIEGGYILRAKTSEDLLADTIMPVQAYLNQTDWYAIRFAETGVEIPEDVKTKRAEARAEISRLRGEAV